jgi:hypothetical protein
MPSDPLIIPLIEDLVRTLKDMSVANGYHFDYDGVELGKYVWEAEDYHGTPRIQVFVNPVNEGGAFGGERATSRFRLEDQVHAMVHLKSDDGNVVYKALRVRADLHKAFFVDRNQGAGAGGNGRPNTFHEGTEFFYYSEDGRKILGATVDATFRIRWDHTSGDQTSDS